MRNNKQLLFVCLGGVCGMCMTDDGPEPNHTTMKYKKMIVLYSTFENEISIVFLSLLLTLSKYYCDHDTPR